MAGVHENRTHPGYTEKTPDLNQGGAECGAVGALSDPIDADLRAIIDAWPALPEAVKSDILAMVKAAGIAKP
jgi:hypothetical protein